MTNLQPFFDGEQLITAFELHSVEGVRAALDAGVSARDPIRGKPPVHWLTEMYSRGDGFAKCLRILLDRGAVLDDPAIEPVLLNDAARLADAIRADRSLLEHRTTMVSAFTPLVGASLLHVAAEYGHADVARVLIEAGADVHAKAATDEHGLNGHTPLFHTVNSIHNHAAPILSMLLDAGARCDVALRGITWGKGFEWETTLLDMTPISYAQCGLLPQMHRAEGDVYRNIEQMLRASGRALPSLENVPNRYLRPRVR